jgi:transposase-like protein
LFEKYQRRELELDRLIGDTHAPTRSAGVFIKGISQVALEQVLKSLNGVKPSASTVSRVFHGLEEEYAGWKARDLPERYVYLYADGTYFSVIGEEGHKMPILALIGITPEGRRELIAFTTGERENEAAWCNLLDDIQARGVRAVDLWVTDRNQATAALPRQRHHAQVPHESSAALHAPQNGREACPGARARQATRPSSSGFQSHPRSVS